MKPRNEPEKSVNHRWTPMNTDTEKTLNMRKQRERRLAAREHKEHERSRIPWVRSGRKTGGDGKRWVGKRAFPTLSGQMVGKWCSFSHLETALTRLFPHVSTQVVDFPHLAHVRLFWEGIEDSRISGRGMIGRGIGRKPNGAWKSFRTGTVGRLN